MNKNTSIVFSANSSVNAVLKSIEFFVPVVDALESKGLKVQFIVVAYANDKDIEEFLNNIDGIDMVYSDPFLSLYDQWELGKEFSKNPVSFYAAASNPCSKKEVIVEDVLSWVGYGESKAVPSCLKNPELESATIVTPKEGAVRIGRSTYASGGTLIRTWDSIDEIVIGKYCTIGDNVQILHPGTGCRRAKKPDESIINIPATDGHHLETASTFPMRFLTHEAEQIKEDFTRIGDSLIIGNNVWIGYGSIIMGSPKIGDGAVIGAGSVVTKDVPAFSVVVGNPAKVAKMRFSKEVIDALLRIQWWEWPEELIASRWRDIYGDIGDFVRKFDTVDTTRTT